MDTAAIDREIAEIFKATQAPGFRYAFKERQVLGGETEEGEDLVCDAALSASIARHS